MRVGIIVYGLERHLTGIGRYTIELVRALSKQAVEVVLLSCGGVGELKNLPLKIVPLRGSYLLPGLMSMGQLQLPFLAHRLGLDIIHDTTGMMPFLLPMGKTRFVTTLYDVIPWSYPNISTKWDELIYRYWHPLMKSRVDAIVTISQSSKQDIIRYLSIPENKIHNVYSGVSPAYQPASTKEIERIRYHYQLPEKYILYVGNLEERKNLQRVLRAYKEIKDDGFPHQLVLVGPKKWKYEKLFTLLIELQLQDAVIFTGYVPAKDLPALYTAADVFVFPSLYEGFGLPVLEAMGCGTPVITSNISSLPEVSGDAAILVDPYDVQQISSAIRQVLTQGQIRENLRELGLKRLHQFTWEQTAASTLNVYTSLINL